MKQISKLSAQEIAQVAENNGLEVTAKGVLNQRKELAENLGLTLQDEVELEGEEETTTAVLKQFSGNYPVIAPIRVNLFNEVTGTFHVFMALDKDGLPFESPTNKRLKGESPEGVQSFIILADENNVKHLAVYGGEGHLGKLFNDGANASIVGEFPTNITPKLQRREEGMTPHEMPVVLAYLGEYKFTTTGQNQSFERISTPKADSPLLSQIFGIDVVESV